MQIFVANISIVKRGKKTSVVHHDPQKMEVSFVFVICAMILTVFDVVFRFYKRLNYIKTEQRAAALKIGVNNKDTED